MKEVKNRQWKPVARWHPLMPPTWEWSAPHQGLIWDKWGKTSICAMRLNTSINNQSLSFQSFLPISRVNNVFFHLATSFHSMTCIKGLTFSSLCLWLSSDYRLSACGYKPDTYPSASPGSMDPNGLHCSFLLFCKCCCLSATLQLSSSTTEVQTSAGVALLSWGWLALSGPLSPECFSSHTSLKMLMFTCTFASWARN